MARTKFRVKDEYVGQEVSYWVTGYPRVEVLSAKSDQKVLARLFAYRHPAIERDIKQPEE